MSATRPGASYGSRQRRRRTWTPAERLAVCLVLLAISYLVSGGHAWLTAF